MDKIRSTKELWRLGLNTFLTQIMAGLLYSVSVIGYLPSLHRFVTNPTLDNLNGTNTSLSKVNRMIACMLHVIYHHNEAVSRYSGYIQSINLTS